MKLCEIRIPKKTPTTLGTASEYPRRAYLEGNSTGCSKKQKAVEIALNALALLKTTKYLPEVCFLLQGIQKCFVLLSIMAVMSVFIGSAECSNSGGFLGHS